MSTATTTGASGAAGAVRCFLSEHGRQLIFGGLFHPALGRLSVKRVAGFGETGIVEHAQRLYQRRLMPIPVDLCPVRTPCGRGASRRSPIQRS